MAEIKGPIASTKGAGPNAETKQAETITMVNEFDPAGKCPHQADDPHAHLVTLARHLHDEGRPLSEIFFRLHRENFRLGLPCRAIATIVRTIPGMESYDAIAAWLSEPQPKYGTIPFARRVTMPGASATEARRKRRGKRLAELLMKYGDEVRPALLELLAPCIAAAVAGEGGA